MNLPDLRRAQRNAFTRPRLMAGAMASVGLGGAVFHGALSTYDAGTYLVNGILVLQSLVVLVYGTQAVFADMVRERAGKTWDIVRLTPLSSLEVAAGKLLGAPAYALFLAAVLAPWQVAGVWVGNTTTLTRLLLCWLALGLTTTASYSLALAGACILPETQVARVGPAGVFIGAVASIGMWLFWAAVADAQRWGHLPHPDFLAVLFGSVALWTAWAVAAARWQVGRLLREPGDPWRQPLFVAFAWLHISALSALADAGLNAAAVTVPAVASLLFAMVGLEDPRAWGRWLDALGARRWGEAAARVPGWMLGWAAVAAAGLASAVLYGGTPAAATALAVPLFLARDLMLIQGLGLRRWLRPESAVLGLGALAYLVPYVVLWGTDGLSALPFFVPVAFAGSRLLDLLVPALGQAALAGIFLHWAGAGTARRERRLERREPLALGP